MKLAKGKLRVVVRVKSHSLKVKCSLTGPSNISLIENSSWDWGRRNPNSAAPMVWLSKAQGKKFCFPFSHLRNKAVTIVPVTRQHARLRTI